MITFHVDETRCSQCKQLVFDRIDPHADSTTLFDRETIEDTEVGGWIHTFSPHRCVEGNDEA